MCEEKDWNPQRAPLFNTEICQLMELVCMDFLTLEQSKGGIEDILVVTDHFTKYAQAYPTRNQCSKTTAKTLFDNFFVHYGFPRWLHSDQGRNFESKLIAELCQMANIKKSHSTPYHLMGNGISESSTPLFSICLALWIRRRRLTGKVMSDLLSMHITVPSMT